ncbi:lipolytic enzyme, GDSL family [Williamsoniiplasma luminosum]|uniref:Lipolytic enzyme, GDSL family n=1 Tax=Williamsoniiplasma luminosum TaxID=214888 RepID=A0A2K8NT87_9MOLU|nr:SGNH/GDSL hydrolase family protein [Williamsoniiplasma luminosum]ATZ16999.1 lipolytic enzyme, GDSL family [Williamsoniiplasma luminosum]
MKKLLSYLIPTLLMVATVATTVSCVQKTPVDPKKDPLYLGKMINKSHAIDSSEQTKSGFTNYFIIGDSLSDVDGLSTLIPAKFNNSLIEFEVSLGGVGYGEVDGSHKGINSFTNGETAGYQLSKMLGFSQAMKPSNIFEKTPKYDQNGVKVFGKNYAVGGATAAKLGFPSSLMLNDATVDIQTKALLEQHKIKDKDLVFMEIGGNDLLSLIQSFEDQSEAQHKFMMDGINRIRTALFNLLNNGVKHIIFMTPPQMNFVPSFKEHFKDFNPIDDEGRRINNICNEFYKALREVLKEVEQYYPKAVELFDIFQDETIQDLQQKFKEASKNPDKVNIWDSYSKSAFEISINDQPINMSPTALGNLIKNPNAIDPALVKNKEKQPIKIKVKIKADVAAGNEGKNIDDFFFTDSIHQTKGVHKIVAEKLLAIAQAIAQGVKK